MSFQSSARFCLRRTSPSPLLAGPTHRGFRHHPNLQVKQMPPRPTIDEGDISEAFVKGSGPGGQKINKTCSAVQLIHAPTGMVIKSQATRSRTQNRKIARRILAEKLEEQEKGTESRLAVKAEVKRKRKASAGKKARRKYRRLEEEKKQQRGKEDGGRGSGDEEEGEGDEEGEGEQKRGG
ncbi:MAG: hypothetical protein M1816_000246 [Peltula sp. TS41687]|nr:MAG: hypothetical protein M1816_000246 [Peltula sp. TS41687]